MAFSVTPAPTALRPGRALQLSSPAVCSGPTEREATRLWEQRRRFVLGDQPLRLRATAAAAPHQRSFVPANPVMHVEHPHDVVKTVEVAGVIDGTPEERLWARQEALGAVAGEPNSDSAWVTAETFGEEKDEDAIRAVGMGVALFDRSSWGRLKLSDADCVAFLHNQSTNDIQKLKSGQGCDTCLVTAQARLIDLALALRTDDNIILLVSPNKQKALAKHFDKYIFFQDKVKVEDLTSKTACFTLIGPSARDVLGRMSIDVRDMCGLTYAHKFFSFQRPSGRMDVMLVRNSGLTAEGFTIVVNADQAADLWSFLEAQGARPLGTRAWNKLRVKDGRPAAGLELTEEYNPLEAGLWHAVSLDKGCYIGQETLARLNTYKGVKTQIWGLTVSGAAAGGRRPAAGDPIFSEEGEKIGVVSSVAEVEDKEGLACLAYVRTKVRQEGGRSIDRNI
eukprot:tig00000057_g104.t1